MITELPKNNRLKAKALVLPYLNSEGFERFACEQGYALEDIFINVIPIVIGSGVELIQAITDHISPKSTEAKFFQYHFKNIGKANFKSPEYLQMSSGVFQGC
jgi:hypothetical protein